MSDSNDFFKNLKYRILSFFNKVPVIDFGSLTDPLLEELNQYLIENQLPPYNIPLDGDLQPSPYVDDEIFITWEKSYPVINIYPDNNGEADVPLEIPLSKPITSLFYQTYSQEVTTTINDKKYGILNAHPTIFKKIDYQTNYSDNSKLLDFYQKFIEKNVKSYQENVNRLGQLKTNISDNTFLKINLPSTTDNFFICSDKNLNELYAFYEERNKEIENFKYNVRFCDEIKHKKLNTNSPQQTTNNLETFIINNNHLTNYLISQIEKLAIPLNILDDSEGKTKNRLQITWRHENYSINKSEKIINIPLPIPIDNINIDLLKNTFPSKLNFGLTRYNILLQFKNNEGWKQTIKTQIYGEGESDSNYADFIENTYKKWLANLSDPNLILKQWSVTHIDNNSQKPIKTGVYVPYKALYLGWEEETGNFTRWILKARWNFN